MPITVHAGEDGPASAVRKAIDARIAPAVSLSSLSGTITFAITMAAGALMTLAAIRWPAGTPMAM